MAEVPISNKAQNALAKAMLETNRERLDVYYGLWMVNYGKAKVNLFTGDIVEGEIISKRIIEP